MIDKTLNISVWEDRPAMALMEVGRSGWSGEQFQKLAAAESFTKDIKPEKGFSFVHVITTGAGEYYGANSNADWYNEKSRPFTFTSPQNSQQKTASLAGGLSEYHKTYMKFGGVYREHKNSRKGFDKEGQVVSERYNPERHRGELILKLEDGIWDKDLQKIASGEPVSWSVGCGVPYDICSVCGNHAKNRNQYCEHLRFSKLQLDKEGRQIFAVNDQPHFHDISRVAEPADKIALTLQKVASGRNLLFGNFVKESGSGFYMPAELIWKLGTESEKKKLSLIQKLAEIEKKIKVEPEMVSDIGDAMKLSGDEEDRVVDSLKDIDLPELLAGLSKNDMLLPPGAFIRIVINKRPDKVDNVVNLPCALENVFSDILEGGGEGLEDVLSDNSFSTCGRCPGSSAEDAVKELPELLSLKPEAVKSRIIQITVSPRKLEKESSSGEPTPEARVLAREYAKYQLSYLAGRDESQMKLAVLKNMK